MTNLFTELWNIALTMIEYINIAWEWLTTKLVITIPIKIPLIIPDGFTWDTGITPIALLGPGVAILVIYWVVLK